MAGVEHFELGQHAGLADELRHDAQVRRRVDEGALDLHRIGVNDVLIVIGGGQVDQLSRVTQADRGKRLDLAGIECKQNFFNVGEGAAFTFSTGLALGQIVETEHHVLRGHGDRLA